ncbi:MAG: peroxiredoxin-like family protein [Luteibaculum sp.]
MRTLILLVFSLICGNVIAQQEISPAAYGMDTSTVMPKGLKTGDSAPNFTAFTAKGDTFQLSDELKNGPVVITFYRGQWCPICNRYLSNLSDSLQYILETGAKVIALSPQRPSAMEQTQQKSKTEVLLLEDRKGEIMEAYDVDFRVSEAYKTKVDNFFAVDLANAHLDSEATLPVPATFVVNQNGEIIFHHFDYNYSNRASALEIGNALGVVWPKEKSSKK